MAEDPRTRAHNEAMRQKKISDEKEAQRQRGRKAEEEMRARMSRDYKKTQESNSGCPMVLALMTGVPLALAAFKWMA